MADTSSPIWDRARKVKNERWPGGWPTSVAESEMEKDKSLGVPLDKIEGTPRLRMRGFFPELLFSEMWAARTLLEKARITF